MKGLSSPDLGKQVYLAQQSHSWNVLGTLCGYRAGTQVMATCHTQKVSGEHVLEDAFYVPSILRTTWQYIKGLFAPSKL